MAKRKKKNKAGHTGKVKYPTYEEAARAAHYMTRRVALKGNAIVSFVNAYRCKCGGYHIGKSRDIDWNRVK